FQEKKAQQGVPPAVVFGFSLLVVFLILAALYESWTLPFSVLLSTPVAVFGAFFVLWLRRTVLLLIEPAYLVQIESDVYSQIGLVMLIGLAAKNAILIVEFAKDAYDSGQELTEAALAGARLRLRPILMTSFAFVLGCVPLWTASGAGSRAHRLLRTTGHRPAPACRCGASRPSQCPSSVPRWKACRGPGPEPRPRPPPRSRQRRMKTDEPPAAGRARWPARPRVLRMHGRARL